MRLWSDRRPSVTKLSYTMIADWILHNSTRKFMRTMRFRRETVLLWSSDLCFVFQSALQLLRHLFQLARLRRSRSRRPRNSNRLDKLPPQADFLQKSTRVAVCKPGNKGCICSSAAALFAIVSKPGSSSARDARTSLFTNYPRFVALAELTDFDSRPLDFRHLPRRYSSHPSSTEGVNR
jgi:hypothetical protein